MKYFRYIFYTVLIAAAMSIPAFSQETQTRVVDEVIAVVNDGVITLSRVKRESKSIVDTYVQEGKSRHGEQEWGIGPLQCGSHVAVARRPPGEGPQLPARDGIESEAQHRIQRSLKDIEL